MYYDDNYNPWTLTTLKILVVSFLALLGAAAIVADALPKDEIFSHLAKALPDGTILSYRIYEKGLRRLLDSQSVFNLPSEFKEYARIRPEPPVNNTSVFIIKNTGR